MQVALTIAGSDSGGGAGIQADLKTFEAHDVFGTSVITAVTAQNTKSVDAVWPVPIDMVRSQMRSVLSDFRVRAIKTGMLFDAATIRCVAEELRQHDLPLVVDPVMVATSGDALLQSEALSTLKEELLPLARVITPNIPEAEQLAGIPIGNRSDMEFAAQILQEFFPEAWILIKGGHLEGETEIHDLLYKRESFWMESKRIRTRHTHGTGCTLSAAITAHLSKKAAVFGAVKEGRSFVHRAILHAWRPTSGGRGSLRHKAGLKNEF